MTRPLILLLAFWLVSFTAAHDTAQVQDLLSPRAQVSLLTVYPGDAVYAQFGHTALRVHDPLIGFDYVYNYGTFDFSDPMFVPRFIRGQLDYQLSVAPFHAVLDHYRHERRAVVEQVLALSQVQRENLFRLLEINARPENREYRYRFLSDNCSTRPRDMIEAAAPGIVWGEPAAAPQTFRQWLSPYLAGDRWLGLGIHLMLGQPADRMTTARQAMFLPLPLMEAADRATINDAGDVRPLVARTQRLYWPDRAGEIKASRPWPAVVMWFLLLAAAATTARAHFSESRRRWCGSESCVARLDAAMFAVAGLAGVVALGMWTGTLHEVTGPNWNLLWALPTHLIAAALLLKRELAPPVRTILRRYFQITAIMTAATLLAWPVLPQSLPGAVWPFAALLALRSWRRGWPSFSFHGRG